MTQVASTLRCSQNVYFDLNPAGLTERVQFHRHDVSDVDGDDRRRQPAAGVPE